MSSQRKRSKDEQILMDAAESIGSALGAIAAKAGAATKAAGKVLNGRKIAKTAEQVATAIRGRKRASRPGAKRRSRRKPVGATSGRRKRGVAATSRMGGRRAAKHRRS